MCAPNYIILVFFLKLALVPEKGFLNLYKYISQIDLRISDWIE